MYRETSENWYSENSSCPICASSCYKKEENVTSETIRTQPTMVVCPTCGKFRFSTSVKLNGFFNDALAKQFSYKLSYHLRSLSERALGKCDSSLFPLYTDKDLKKITENRDPSVAEKLQMLLKYLADLSEYPGQQIQLDPEHDYSIPYCVPRIGMK